MTDFERLSFDFYSQTPSVPIFPSPGPLVHCQSIKLCVKRYHTDIVDVPAEEENG